MTETKSKKKEIKVSPEQLIADYRQVLFTLRFQQKAGELGKTHQIKKAKRELARLLTKQKLVKSQELNS